MLLFGRNWGPGWAPALGRGGAFAALLAAAAFPGAATAQTNYPPLGAEYAIAGSLPADQLRPQLSINASGGFLVWEDNSIDGNGMGIAAIGLNSSLNSVSTPFRVNQRIGSEQEHPQVALLDGGGAAFVWQGGLPGLQHIYARFLSASNTWLGPDVLLSTATNTFQINPSIAKLTNGNVVVVWGSYNQFSSSSMQDVYGQILSPTGSKVGSEFLVNQFTSYNQRDPSVAALAGGGFVVVWASEQQRVPIETVSNSVDSAVLGGGFATAETLLHPSVDVLRTTLRRPGLSRWK